MGLCAKTIHENSKRASQPFVVVDCGALPDALVESLLFGHEKGSITGAEKKQEGLIIQAHGGTLMLDEVGDLPLSAQKFFLRILQERCFRPIGGKSEKPVDFRLVAATNLDLDQMVLEKKYLKMLLDKTNGDRDQAILISGISPSRLYGLLKKHNFSGFGSPS